MTVPLKSRIRFVALLPVALSPALLGGFGTNDLDDIHFDGLFTWRDPAIQWASHLTGLRKLDVSNCEITAASVGYLGKIEGLADLHFSAQKISTFEW